MPVDFNKVKHLIQKESVDFLKNKNVSLMCPIPVILTLFFIWVQDKEGSLGIYGLNLLNMSMNMNLVIVSTFALSLLIAEEKEKKTSLSLWLASVSLIEYLLGKAIVIFTLSMLTHLSLYFMIGIPLKFLFEFMLLSTLVTMIMITLGAIIGLLAEHQMSVSFLGLPVVFVYFILPMPGDLTSPWSQIASIFPNYHFAQMIYKMGTNNYLTSLNFKVVFLWLILSIMALFIVYRKKKVDFFNLK